MIPPAFSFIFFNVLVFALVFKGVFKRAIATLNQLANQESPNKVFFQAGKYVAIALHFASVCYIIMTIIFLTILILSAIVIGADFDKYSGMIARRFEL